ncbi:hypothetical protein [Macrococcoides caseolyticum]|uniref:hypothetical protein n=1 Tax=Macrococcoides caseolyticum TaxID=69966 RepID=UPI000C32AD0D|nr:hypothetical protein [Macrococcus caseolyticus]PKE22738.1 hypothetical protein CW688_01010 [Macrococcus caseolyticus]PKE36835.1 hypothetical protein CW695_00330 [Macrococcus caseolyticus]PKE75095.1 hypothetical protein CW670_02580 [Macrococcus caseolyticus]
MNDRIKELAQEISKILKEEKHPYVKVEIDSDGIKVLETMEFVPSEIKKVQESENNPFIETIKELLEACVASKDPALIEATAKLIEVSATHDFI